MAIYLYLSIAPHTNGVTVLRPSPDTVFFSKAVIEQHTIHNVHGQLRIHTILSLLYI